MVLEESILTLKIPSDSYNIETDSAYSVQRVGSYLILSTDSKYISYFSKQQVEKTSEDFFFIAQSPMPGLSEVSLSLPSGAIVDEGFFLFPKNYTMETDGKNIIISWDGKLEEILVSYHFVEDNNFLFYLLIIFLLMVLGLLMFFEIKKTKQTVTQNLFGDEKQIINFLIKNKNKSAWTKELVNELGIPKVRLSRKLRSLEEKELIGRTPYGNENRIKLTK
jgi:hypothetical protein